MPVVLVFLKSQHLHSWSYQISPSKVLFSIQHDSAKSSSNSVSRFVNHLFPIASAPFFQAAEIVDNDDRSRQAIEYYGKAARLLVRQQQYEEALKIITREIDAHLSVSIIHLLGCVACTCVILCE